MTVPTAEARPTSARQVFRRAFIWGAVLTAVVAVVGGAVGWFAAGWPGLVSALIGAGIALVFTALTTVGVLIADRYDSAMFLIVTMGGFLLKLVLFIVLMSVLRGQPFIAPLVLFATSIAAVVGTLAIDAFVVMRSRIPVTSTAG